MSRLDDPGDYRDKLCQLADLRSDWGDECLLNETVCFSYL